MRRKWIADQLDRIDKLKEVFAKEAFGGERPATTSDLLAGRRAIKVDELPKIATSLKMTISAVLDHELPAWRGSEPQSANHAKLTALNSSLTPEEAGRAFEILQLTFGASAPRTGPQPRRSGSTSRKQRRAKLSA